MADARDGMIGATISGSGTSVSYKRDLPMPMDCPPGHAIVCVHAVAPVTHGEWSKSCEAFSGTVLKWTPRPVTTSAGTQTAPASRHAAVDAKGDGHVRFGGSGAAHDSAPHGDVHWQPGQRVFGRASHPKHDALQEIIVVPDHRLHRGKTNLSDEENACLAGPGVLACRALQLSQLPAGGKPRVYIHGAHTAVGTFAVQAARAFKCEVEASAPLEHHARLRELGCDDFCDTQSVKGANAGQVLAAIRGRSPRNFHACVDIVGNDTSLYDNLDRFTHEGTRYLTTRPQSVSWRASILKRVASLSREYLYLHHPPQEYYALAGTFKEQSSAAADPHAGEELTDEDRTCARELALAYALVGNPEFVDIELDFQSNVLPIARLQEAIDLVRHQTLDNESAGAAEQTRNVLGCVAVVVVDRDGDRFAEISAQY